MGSTAVALIYSRFGKRSGAHMNPATTMAFLRLGKIESVDAMFCGLLYGEWLSHRTVHYVVTRPGRFGEVWAFVAEAAITFVLMSVILHISNRPAINRLTRLVAGLLVMIYISVEAPVSGMSMNPARTLGSALSAGDWTAIWIYFTGPPLGMLLAAEIYVRRQGAARVLCAKLHHENTERCIFRCRYPRC
jgi:aquaporin Z